MKMNSWMRKCRAPLLAAALAGALAAADKPSVAPAKVDLNAADMAMLETLPGVGPNEAQAIVAARPFKSTDELERVAALGHDKAEALKPFVTVAKVPEAKTAKAGPAGWTKTKVDLNQADVLTLETLPGVGPALARSIIAARPFKSLSDLDRVSGLTTEQLEAIRRESAVAEMPAPPEHKLGEPSLEPTGRPSANGSQSTQGKH